VKRSEGLDRATDAAREFLRRGQRSSATSLRRSQIARKRKPRDTELTQREARAQQRFKRAGHAQGCCQSCGYDGAFLEVHHAIAKSLLKRLLLKKGEPVTPEVLWDPENALLLCSEPAPNRCHSATRWQCAACRDAPLRS
jgi:hypothetical protein